MILCGQQSLEVFLLRHLPGRRSTTLFLLKFSGRCLDAGAGERSVGNRANDKSCVLPLVVEEAGQAGSKGNGPRHLPIFANA